MERSSLTLSASLRRWAIVNLFREMSQVTRYCRGTLNNRIGGTTHISLEGNQTLVVYVGGENPEQLLESTGTCYVCPDTETRTDILFGNRWDVMHPVRYVFATNQIVYGLTEWKLNLGRILQTRNLTFGLHSLASDPTTDIGCNNFGIHEIHSMIPGFSDYIWGGRSRSIIGIP